MRKTIFGCVLFMMSLFLVSSNADAAVYNDTARFTQGFGKVLTSAFQLPVQLISKSFSQAPPIGIINGALTGTFRTVTGLMSGVWDMAGAAAPYAKYAAFI